MLFVKLNKLLLRADHELVMKGVGGLLIYSLIS